MENLVKNSIVTLKKGEGRSLKAGGAWIFDNEIESIMGTFTNGDIVKVHDFDGYELGAGFINQNSKIRVRMLTRNRNCEVTKEFLEDRVKAAWDYRKAVMGKDDLNCCRLIFGEADFLPGLVIDKYNDVLVVESLSLGMDRIKTIITDHLKKLLSDDGYNIKGVYERSDAPVRKKEGMEPHKGFIGEEFDTNVEIVENGVKYTVDVVNGQKTGFFLDQKYNRLSMQKVIKGLKSVSENVRVLDCFTHMGTFALNAGYGGAKSVLGLDISEYAIQQATENAKRNQLQGTVQFRVANVLDELPKMVADGRKFDVVILDPPAFTKSREATRQAIRGYREINMQGLRLVENGGYLATCSCSHFMTQELFVKTVKEAARSVHKRLRQVEARTQAPDHPILWGAEDSYYLKFYIFQVSIEK